MSVSFRNVVSSSGSFGFLRGQEQTRRKSDLPAARGIGATQ